MANAFSQRGLTFKQILLTVLAALLVGGAVTALQSWNSLQAERAAAEARMALLMDAARENPPPRPPSVSTRIWRAT